MALTDQGTHSVNINGGRLHFSVGTRLMPEGYLGWVCIGGVEVYATGPFDRADRAATAAVRHTVATFGKLITGRPR